MNAVFSDIHRITSFSVETPAVSVGSRFTAILPTNSVQFSLSSRVWFAQLSDVRAKSPWASEVTLIR